MHGTRVIFHRELGAYLRSPLGYVVAALLLLIDGILFQSWALGAGKRLSADVLREFFYVASGTTMAAGIVLSIRLLAEERQNGTIVLLHTSPVRDVEIVLGKYLAAFVFLALMTLATLYMPLLILVNGKISLGQVAVGYLGLLLLGGAALAMGTFASALTRHQLIAAAAASAMVMTGILLWNLSQVVSPPVRDVLAGTALWARHFPPFMRGVLQLQHVVYYLAVAYFFLLAAVKTLEAKRWQ